MKFRQILLTSAALAMSLAVSQSAMSETKKPHTLGLGLSYFAIAMYQTADTKEECPQGLTIGDEEQFTTRYPDKEQQLALLSKVPSRDARSPDGANTYSFPMLTEGDPVPHRLPFGNKGFGLNLDGTADGQATDKTCRHEKMKDPTTGEAGIDNQLARLNGCGLIYRSNGLFEASLQVDTLTKPNRWLLEVTGVDDETSDDSVEVNFYMAKDPIRWSLVNEAIPFNSQRIDESQTRYEDKVHGKIVNGELITDPLPKKIWPSLQQSYTTEWVIQDMRLRLKLNPQGADGVIAGYLDTERWWRQFIKVGAHRVSTKMSAPNMYRAMQDMADGHKDAAGKCNSMSAAYKTRWVRTFVVHGDSKTAKHEGEKLASN